MMDPHFEPRTQAIVECCFYKQGFCKYGKDCRFSHTDTAENPCQFGKNCRAGHGQAYFQQQQEEDELLRGMNSLSRALEVQLGLEEPLHKNKEYGQQNREEYRKLTRPAQVAHEHSRGGRNGRRPPQPFDYYCVLDVEGRKEIVEFPVFLFNSRTLEVEAQFHRYVMPAKIPKEEVKRIVRSKYGSFPPDPVTGRDMAQIFFERAIPFTQVIAEFKTWLKQHIRSNRSFAFVTCGNWDVCRKIPEQCELSQIPLPDFFLQWINLKDIFLNFYDNEARGMKSMLKNLGIEWDERFHHSGYNDVENITKVLKTMIEDGASINITASKDPSTGNITYAYTRRI